MTNELLTLFEYYEKEKGIKRETMVEALEKALLAALRKSIGPARGLRIKIDPEKGDIRAFASLVVRDRVTNSYEEIDIFTSRRISPGIDVGAELEVDITPKNFGRIAAQTAKQTMMQSLRQAEKEQIYDEFKDRAGDIVSGTVRRFERGDVYIDLGKFEGVMHQRERVSTEEYNVNDRIRAYVVAVENGTRGPEIILSRSHPNFVRRLFESEVSEIADRTVEIRSLAREAGYRTKVAVYSADEKVDPVGACVGLRGARVKNIVRELNNEKVDIIRWTDDVRQLVTEALKPAEIKSITINEEAKSVLVKVDEEELSKAIGRRGQNARLTARLIGWDVQVQKDESAHEAFEAQVASAAAAIAGGAGIDIDVATLLVRGGLNSLEMLANDVDEVDIAGVLGIPVEEALQIRNRIILATGGSIETIAVEAIGSETAIDETTIEDEAPDEEVAVEVISLEEVSEEDAPVAESPVSEEEEAASEAADSEPEASEDAETAPASAE